MGVKASIRSENLTKRHPSGGRELTVLDGVSIEVADGEFVAVLGPSGSGKSTLLGLLAGLDRPSSGKVFLDDWELSKLSEDRLAKLRKQEIGFVFQDFQLLENLTARENVLLPLELSGVPTARERADEVLAMVGLAQRGHHYPAELSGGEQQRVALARAFGPKPRVLFADEPTGNLDTATGNSVLELICELRRAEGTTLILVTHDAQVAAAAERRIHLAGGRVVLDESDNGPDSGEDKTADASAAARSAETNGGANRGTEGDHERGSQTGAPAR